MPRPQFELIMSLKVSLSPIDLIVLIALGPPKNRQIGRVLEPSWTLNCLATAAAEKSC